MDPANADIGLMSARLYASTGRPAEARMTLEKLRPDAPRNAHVLYALAELDAPHANNIAADPRYENELHDVIAVAPATLPSAQAGRCVGAAAGRQPATAREVRRARPRCAGCAAQLEQTFSSARQEDREARPPLDRYLHLTELTHHTSRRSAT
jgi:hypothetical protein